MRIWLHSVNSATEVSYNRSRELPLIRTNIQDQRIGPEERRKKRVTGDPSGNTVVRLGSIPPRSDKTNHGFTFSPAGFSLAPQRQRPRIPRFHPRVGSAVVLLKLCSMCRAPRRKNTTYASSCCNTSSSGELLRYASSSTERDDSSQLSRFREGGSAP